MNDANLDLTISRLIKAPCKYVWQAWANPAHLEQWWCPKPWTTQVREFDLAAGGAFDTLMLGPNGEREDNPGCFLAVEPMERVVFTSVLAKGWRPAPDYFMPMTAIITMADEGENTRYQARVLHKNPEDKKRHEEMGFHEGWGICIQQLEEMAIKLLRQG